MTPKLKPCPFCGETPDVDGAHTFGTDTYGKWGWVQCCCRGPEVRTLYEDVEHWRDDAIEIWNERLVSLKNLPKRTPRFHFDEAESGEGA